MLQKKRIKHWPAAIGFGLHFLSKTTHYDKHPSRMGNDPAINNTSQFSRQVSLLTIKEKNFGGICVIYQLITDRRKIYSQN